MLLAFLLPATFGAVAVAKPLYTVFYGQPDGLALGLFIVAMLQTVILGLYTVLSPMIQALFQNRKAIRYFLYGVVVKSVPTNSIYFGLSFLWTTFVNDHCLNGANRSHVSRDPNHHSV